jgi:hypothetical protein
VRWTGCMGVWNTTCGISFLPIRAGAVRVWILALHPPTFGQDDHLFGPTSLATPLALPLQASFQGYGVEQIADEGAERLLFSHVRDLHERGEFRLEPEPFPNDLEGLIGAVGDGRVVAKIRPAGDGFGGSAPRELRLSLMYVDERVYRATIAAIRSSNDWEAGRRLGGNNGPKDAADAVQALLGTNANFAFYRDAAMQSAELRERLAEQYDFEVALDLLRRHYAPPTGVGSQSEAYGLHAEIADAVLRVAREDDRDSE